MRSQSTVAFLVGLCGAITLALFVGAKGKDPWYILDDRWSFESVADLKEFFRKNDIPFEVEQLEASGNRFVFVTAAPYTGFDWVDFYCYVERPPRGKCYFYSVLVIRGSKSGKASVRKRGGFIEVVHEGEVVMTLNSRAKSFIGGSQPQQPIVPKSRIEDQESRGRP